MDRDNINENDSEYQSHEEAIEFHIKAGDYFGTLATIISLLKENIEQEGYTEENGRVLKRLEHRFMYLQDNYTIIRKEEIK